ncbi:hypothetical protein GCM10010116_12680 [Microbispora rosea subsp. aerata]|nr:hypothetical protein [Microbispora rosea]GGO06436.1 hypothetical protein GCM10010116_12680 [Microbispora rosea subsp. aerata]GIH55125.1 hypothetical protein Mro02_20390 [Microbispora rosea subsp. aerata]GLJ82574.1 hypothetical protein GCM10017588_12990 [Microbispora rosea subsp. aerata]
MGYPGDQQPPPPRHTPDPRRRDLPPYAGGDTSPPSAPHQREQAPYRREPSPYAREQAPHPPYQQGQPPYGGRAPYEQPREQENPNWAERHASGPGPYAAPPGGQVGGQFVGQPGQAAGPPGDQIGGPPGGQAGGQMGGDWDARQQPAAPRVPPPPEPEWDPDAKGPLWRRPWVLGLALLALIGALFTGLWYAARNEKPPVAAPTPTGRPSLISQGPTGKYGYTASRATDKTPLSLRELFAKRKLVKNKRSYVRTVTRKEKKCADGVTGDKITKALKAGGCTQLLRASFADAKGTVIGTVGVANLRTSAAAKKVASAGGGGERKDYLKPLPGKDEATKNLGTGEAYAGGWTHGHYAILLWFQFKDGHKPAKNELKRLYQTAVDITDATVFPALDTRALTGGPS